MEDTDWVDANRARLRVHYQSVKANPEKLAARRQRDREAARCRALDPEISAKRLARHRSDNLRRKYGITLAEYDAMFSRQGGACAICGGAPSGAGAASGEHFHVDHCHTTGRVRGLLCADCNIGLGRFADNPARLEQAAAYLRQMW